MPKIVGLIGFSTSSGILSGIIRFFSKSPWSHCFVIFGELAGELVLGEATEPRIRMAPISKYLRKDTKFILYEINDLDDQKVNEAIRKLMCMVSRPYGYFQLFGFMWIWLMDKLGIKSNNPVKDGIVCSRYVYYFLDYAGYKPINAFLARNVSPAILYQSLKLYRHARVVAESPFKSATLHWLFDKNTK